VSEAETALSSASVRRVQAALAAAGSDAKVIALADTARSAAEAIAAWERDFGRCLAEMARVLRPNGHVALLLADSTVGGRALRVERWLPEFAARADLDVVGRAAQPRPHFHAPSSRAFATRPRFEHLVILKPGRSK